MLATISFVTTPPAESPRNTSAPGITSANARPGFLRVSILVAVHQLLAALVHNALDVGHDDVGARQTKCDELIEAGEGCRARPARYELHLRDVLADNLEAVEDARRHHDCGAVLVVMKYGDIHALAKSTLDLEAFGGLDVLEVDASECRLQACDGLDEGRRLLLRDLDVEDVDASELLEQDSFALHHWLGS